MGGGWIKRALLAAGLPKWIAALFVIGCFAVAAAAGLSTRPRHDNTSPRLQGLVSAPPAVRLTLDRSCADCHSDETRWPWYSRVPPASWMVARHVAQGRRFLNLSRFGLRSRIDRQDLLGAIAREVRKGRMPLASYTVIHRDARLSPADARILREWAEKERLRLAASPN